MISPRCRTLTSLVAISIFSLSPSAFSQTEEQKASPQASAAKRAELRANTAELAKVRQKRKKMFSGKRANMKDAKVRAQMVKEMREGEEELRKVVHARAKMKGLALKGTKANGVDFVLVDFDENDQPVYIQTENENAAITTAANLVRSNSNYNNVEGGSVTIGLWEASGIPRISHREYEGRITIEDGTSTRSGHAGHVAGTLIAAGVDSDAMGMAPAARISAFSASGVASELLEYGAVAPGTNLLYISNHSYGVGQGWEDRNWQGSFSANGDSSTNVESDFGRYSFSAEQWDDVTYNLPYHLSFISAGNQRNDDAPREGQEWTRGSETFTYDPDIHPLGDGDYKNGWDNMEGRKLAKNAVTVGATADAVRSGQRDVTRAVTRSFSSRGPVDDGRIKPDLCANGDSLRSADSSGDSSYGTRSGTSMSTPNVCGSTALLVDYYSSRFPGEAMKASTLKALILHTADDDGNPGPDYRYGWGIMNTQAAADLLINYAESNGDGYMVESLVDEDENSSRSHVFAWDGTSPLRATICWTDPAGERVFGHDNRTRTLVNDLNLLVTGPDGTHFPYVMPHVGDWSVSSIDDDAITGVNTVDNVEQVFVEDPVPGNYTITIDYAGNLTNDVQEYSLIITGQTAPEIEVDFDGPPVAELVDGAGVQDFGATAPLDPSVVRNYTVRNVGGTPLSGLTLSKSGSQSGDFSLSSLSVNELESGETASFSISYDPLGRGNRGASVQLASNDANESPFNISLSAIGYNELEAWRVAHFNTANNGGEAADSFDFDRDGISNFLEFAYGSDPREAGLSPFSIEVDETNAFLTYDRSIRAMSDYGFEVVWSNDLPGSEPWSSDEVAEEVLNDDGVIQQVEASVPLSAATRFFRLNVIENP